jgi:hypothetical protein
MRAAELLRAKILRPVPSDEGSSAQPAEGLPHGRLSQERFQALETGLQQRRVRFVEHVADVVVGRNLANTE